MKVNLQSCGPVRNNTLSSDNVLCPFSMYYVVCSVVVHIPQRCKPATFSLNKIACSAAGRARITPQCTDNVIITRTPGGGMRLITETLDEVTLCVIND